MKHLLKEKYLVEKIDKYMIRLTDPRAAELTLENFDTFFKFNNASIQNKDDYSCGITIFSLQKPLYDLLTSVFSR